MSIRGLLLGMAVGIGLVLVPALGLYLRMQGEAPPLPEGADVPASDRVTDVVVGARVNKAGEDGGTHTVETTSTEAEPAGEGREARGTAPPVAINDVLASLSAAEEEGFPPPRSGLLAESDLQSVLARAREQIERGDLVAAHDLLSRTYFAFELTREQRDLFERVLEPLAERLLRSHEELAYGPVHVVQPGDTPARIARPFKIPHELLARINGYGRYIRVGQRLKIVRGPFDVMVELGHFELVVLLNGRFIKRYPIGIGKDDSSPTGLFRVVQKVKNPTWYPVEGGVYPPDDPRNPLGTRWIGIGGSYGIHGTRDPDSIGRPSSRGCIRMRNQDVEEVYDMVVEEYSRVLIRP